MIKYIISILGLVIFVLIVFFYFRSPIFKVPYRGSVNPTPLGGQGLELALYSEYGAL